MFNAEYVFDRLEALVKGSREQDHTRENSSNNVEIVEPIVPGPIGPSVPAVVRATTLMRFHNTPDVTYRRASNAETCDDALVTQIMNEGKDLISNIGSKQASVDPRVVCCLFDGHPLGDLYSPGVRLRAYDPCSSSQSVKKYLPGRFCSYNCQLAWLRDRNGFSTRLLVDQLYSDCRAKKIPMPIRPSPNVLLLQSYSGTSEGLTIEEYRKRYCISRDNVPQPLVQHTIQEIPEPEIVYSMLFREKTQQLPASIVNQEIQTSNVTSDAIPVVSRAPKLWHSLGVLPENQELRGLRMPPYDPDEKLSTNRSQHDGLWDVLAREKLTKPPQTDKNNNNRERKLL